MSLLPVRSLLKAIVPPMTVGRADGSASEGEATDAVDAGAEADEVDDGAVEQADAMTIAAPARTARTAGADVVTVRSPFSG
jgi:hypothetical protein